MRMKFAPHMDVEFAYLVVTAPGHVPLELPCLRDNSRFVKKMTIGKFIYCSLTEALRIVPLATQVRLSSGI
jgi:hypothetical protein